nr:RHS repeat-associated core domain-containing protein [Riemerella anatipestifer]
MNPSTGRLALEYGHYISYGYRADGTKIGKVLNYSSEYVGGSYSEKWDYLDGFQYRFLKYLGTREEPILEIDLETGQTIKKTKDKFVLQFFPTAEGYYDYLHKRYVYHYTDHLGNVRLSYYKGSNNLVIDKESNYYPFGLEHTGYNGLLGNQSYNYKYNGKELQTEIGMYDYGARFYMPDLGRWGVVDPLAEKMARYSPYNYAWDNPVMFVDYDGMFATPPDDYIDASTGKYLGSDGAVTKNIRVIYKNDWNDITSENGGSLSTIATQALQSRSSIVTVNNTQINSDINNANNETIADQTKERQVWVGIEVMRGEVPTAQVTSVRGPDGVDGKTTITMDQRRDALGNIVKQTFTGTKLIPIAQVHTHNTTQDPNLINLPGTSALDKSTSSSSTGFNIPIYAIDSYTGVQANGNAIHRVMPNGAETKNIGTTNANNIGQESLIHFINRQKYP